MPSTTHSVLQHVADNYPLAEWTQRLAVDIPRCTADIAKDLMRGMYKDIAAANEAANAAALAAE